MIFRIKHHWWLALIVTLIVGSLAWKWGAWDSNWAPSRYSQMNVPTQIFIGIGAALAAMAINGVLDLIFKLVLGHRYRQAFANYGATVLGPMRWPEYIAGGLMAALAEEPLFRGLLLPVMLHVVPMFYMMPVQMTVIIVAVIFAACHWLSEEYFGFWLWAMWEGVLLGLLMIVTRSLLITAVAHGVHDVLAYAAFGVMAKREGWRK